MKKKNNYKGFVGIIALAAVLMFALFGCGDSEGGDGPDNGPVKYTVTFNANGGTVSPSSIQVESGKTVTSLPTPTKTSGDNFQGWYTKDGTGGDWGSSFTTATPVTASITVYARWGSTAPTQYTITFNADGGTVSPASKQVSSGSPAGDLPVPVNSPSFFGGWYTAQNGGGTVFTSGTTVTTNITVYAKWVTPTDINNLASFLSSQSGGGSTYNPVNLPITIQLTEANWRAILTAIKTASKYVALDLSTCSRSTANSGGGLRTNGTFDHLNSFEDGKDHITSLILPNAASSIADGDYNKSFRSFSQLTSVSASAITSIGDSAFYGCTSLASVNLPAATSFGDYVFDGCTSLVSVSFPALIQVRDGAFQNCTSLTSVSFPAARSIHRFAFSGTGTTALTITLGLSAPSLGYGIFYSSSSAKTVTVKVPSGATGYGTIPNTYSGTDTSVNWGNGFRGGGWDLGGFFVEDIRVNSNITLYVQYQD